MVRAARTLCRNFRVEFEINNGTMCEFRTKRKKKFTLHKKYAYTSENEYVSLRNEERKKPLPGTLFAVKPKEAR